MIDELAANGYKNILTKPFHENKLRRALHEALKVVSDPTVGTSPIYSQIKGDENQDHWVSDYIDEIKQLVRTLESAIKADDVNSAISVCNTLHSTGVGYGFTILSEVANDAITALNASCSAKESELDLRRLLRVVERVTPT